ncbi:MAG: NAD-dependent epimerase/dehydratase family protein, partial [Candidatus Nezhaarchaeales archaeon]
VTGAAGFIGRRLADELMRRRFSVVGFDKKPADIGCKLIVEDIVDFDFSGILDDVDVIFHLAGLLGTTELFHRVIEAEKVNVLGTLNLLEAMKKCNVRNIVFTSKPNVWKYNVYTITKENCERYLEMYHRMFKFNVAIARLYNVYGPGEDVKEYRKAVPYFIISALKNEPLEVFGDGRQTMDLIYIDDAVEALTRCAEIMPGEVVEIGSSKSVKVIDLAYRIIKLTGCSSRVVFRPMRRGEEGNSIIHANDNMLRLLNFKPRIDLNEGLTRTIAWYKEHLDEFDNIYSYQKEDFIE